MKTYLTSYFSSQAPRERKVAIAKYPPRFWNGRRAPLLAPSNHKAVEWEASYLADLESRFPGGAGLVEYLEEATTGIENPILCCFEKDPAECHRQILAEYAQKHCGLEIREWQPKTVKLLLF